MGAQSDAALISTLELAPLPTATPCFRLHAVAVLKEWGLPRDLVADAETLVSELMTNACDASACLPERPPVALRLIAAGASLVIEAWDLSPLELEPREAGADDECGRGLAVVAALAARWGCERTDHPRKRVWAELAL
ncbi:MAG TPA: ATP-binding protein [Streptosporangiaceae bacterium]|jgi:anti-sigma regulatory factor (Ser/Thr protein kinase)